MQKTRKKRNNSIINTKILDPEERMKDLLFRNKNYKETSKIIRDLWILRRQLLKEREKETIREEQEKSENQTTQRNPPQCGVPQSRIIESPKCDTPLDNLPPCRAKNPPQSGPPQCGLPQCRAKNPPQSGPPQCGLPQCRIVKTR